MTQKIGFSIILLVILLGCNSKEIFVTPSVTATPTVDSAILLTQLAKPITTPTIGYLSRKAYDFIPSPTLAPSATPTNIFLPVSAKDGYNDLIITLERTMCFGTCPAYSLTIYGNGKGVYEGKFSVKVKGVQKFNLRLSQLDKLVKAFEATHYFSLEDYYSVQVTDMPSVMTSIIFQGKSKKVDHYGWCLDYEKTVPDDMSKNAAPQALCDLEKKVDEIVNVQQWVGK